MDSALNRIKTGINGLDRAIDGGFPEKSIILLSCSAGTGKTIFSLQYIYKGASQYSQPQYIFTSGEKIWFHKR